MNMSLNTKSETKCNKNIIHIGRKLLKTKIIKVKSKLKFSTYDLILQYLQKLMYRISVLYFMLKYRHI